MDIQVIQLIRAVLKLDQLVTLVAQRATSDVGGERVRKVFAEQHASVCYGDVVQKRHESLRVNWPVRGNGLRNIHSSQFQNRREQIDAVNEIGAHPVLVRHSRTG